MTLQLPENGGISLFCQSRGAPGWCLESQLSYGFYVATYCWTDVNFICQTIMERIKVDLETLPLRACAITKHEYTH